MKVTPPHYSIELNNAWMYTSAPLRSVFTACCLIKRAAAYSKANVSTILERKIQLFGQAYESRKFSLLRVIRAINFRA
jgi:hypothetical protein